MGTTRSKHLVPSNIAYSPGDAYTPFSTYRHQFPDPRFNFYVSASLDGSFAITDIQRQGTAFTFDLWSDYLLDANNGKKVLSTVYNLDPDSTLGRNSTWNLGGVFRFEDGFDVDERHEFYLDDGARLELPSETNVVGTPSDHVIFNRLNPLKPWDRIRLDHGLVSTLSYADIDGATVGIHTSALVVNIDNVTLTNNGKGILTDFANGGLYVVLHLSNSEILDSSTIGLHARHAFISMSDTEISGSGSRGIAIDDANLYQFMGNTVTDNDGGISVLTGGNITLGPATGYGGNNEVFDNAFHELKTSTTGSSILVGTSAAGGDNSIYKSGNNPTSQARYIFVGSSSIVPLMAENTWWGLGSGPPAGAFTGNVDYTPYWACHWSDPNACRVGVPGMTTSRVEQSTSAMREEGDWQMWLKEEIVAARHVLNGEDGEPGAVHRLAHLQRLDREDELGERRATMAQITALRQRLNGIGDLPDAVQAIGEAALLSEVHAYLFSDDFGTARDLIVEYGSRVEDD